MLVAILALFLSAGGVSYAAVTIPNSSVGTAQLKNLSVTNHKVAVNAIGWRKIIQHTVGTKRVNSSEVQLRVKGACTTTPDQALTSVTDTGAVTCATTLPAEYDTASTALASVTSSTAAAAVASESLPGNASFLVTADAAIQVQSNDPSHQNVQVTCTLTAGPSTTSAISRTTSFDLTYSGEQAATTVPLSVVVPASANAITAQVSCVRSVLFATPTTPAPVHSGGAVGSLAPTVGVSSTINAVQTASNTTSASPAPAATATLTTAVTPPAS
jgi:hypothetical protein